MGTCRSGACQPHLCGDGVRTAGEACDGKDLAGQTCLSLGYYSENPGLACTPSCTFDTSGCTGICGDGITNGTEVCDGAPPDGKTCLDYGHARGFLGCSELCAASTVTCGDFAWQPVPGENGHFVAVWGTSARDIFALDRDYVIHWDGTTWSTTMSPVATDLNGIWGSRPDDVWAVGNNAVIHWNGLAWSPSIDMLDPSGTMGPGIGATNFVGVWGSAPNDVFALGNAPGGLSLVLHWDGTAWSNMAVPSYTNATALWGSGPNDVYVTGGVASAHWDPTQWELLHWDGAQWAIVSITGSKATSIGGWGPDDVYAVGDKETFHWDGQVWTPVPMAPSGSRVWARGPDDVFIVGSSGVSHWNGQVWSMVFDGAVSEVWGDQPDDTYFVGDNIYSPGAAEWFPLAPLGGATGGMADEAIVASKDGSIVERFTPGHWPISLPSPPFVTTFPVVWVSGPDEVWTVGSLSPNNALSLLGHWDGSTWSVIDFAPEGNTSVDFADIGGSAPDDIWAVGNLAAHWDGKTWSTPTQANPTLTGVWARTPTDAYAVGFSGSIVHWDGAEWSPMKSGTSTALYDVWGTGPEVFAVGDNGTILHTTGGPWSPMDTHTSDLLGQISGSGPGNVYVVSHNYQDGGHDGLLHLRSGGWEPIALPGGLSSVASIWATPKSLYLSGSGQADMTYRLDLNGVDCVAPERNCDDGWDNDCDGLQDAADPDCANDKPAEQCANLVDDDGDGLIDCADPDCAQFPSCKGKK
jgi:hypothetical protein